MPTSNASSDLSLVLLGIFYLPVQTNAVLLSEQTIVFGGLAGTTLLGFYLVLANLLGGHSNDVLACQSLPTYKNFARMRIDEHGRLNLDPQGIDKPPDGKCWHWQKGRVVLRDEGAGQPYRFRVCCGPSIPRFR